MPFRWGRDAGEERFYREVETAFAALLDHGYHVIDRHYSAQSFGNGWVPYENDRIRLRVLRDRLHHSADFFTTETGAEAIPYWLLRRRLGNVELSRSVIRSVERFARALVADLGSVRHLLAPNVVEETLEVAQADQRAWFEERFGPVGHRGDASE